jgi:tRNA (cytidine/uridine-2'-O-)-methyltransferase
MKIVLFQPQIPQNTGNIVRTCAATGASLTLVRPLGFSTKSRHLKRAGLDYWEGVDVEEIDDLDPLLAGTSRPFFFFSSKAKTPYTSASFTTDSILVFGSETDGLPARFWERWQSRFYTIPMQTDTRCLNLASSAAIVLYEALRQTHFELLKRAERIKDNERLSKTEVANGK